MEDPGKNRRAYFAFMLTLLFYGAAYLYCRSHGSLISVSAYRNAFVYYEKGLSSSELLVAISDDYASSDPGDIYVYYRPGYEPLKFFFFPLIWSEGQLRALGKHPEL